MTLCARLGPLARAFRLNGTSAVVPENAGTDTPCGGWASAFGASHQGPPQRVLVRYSNADAKVRIEGDELTRRLELGAAASPVRYFCSGLGSTGQRI